MVFEKALTYFYDISAIPRRSKDEKKIREFIKKWSENNHWKYEEDIAWNLLVHATNIMKENLKYSKKICLQSHLDMVCVGRKDHNWENLGVVIVENNGKLQWDSTSLGADNGIGIAAMIAIAETQERPDLELLFTVEEEIWLNGVCNIDLPITAPIWLNLDWSDSNSIGIWCWGTLKISAKYSPKKIKKVGKKFKIILSGFKWGHSGSDIHLEQWNAIIELTKILIERDDIRGLIEMRWWDADNAIPRWIHTIVSFVWKKKIIEEWLLKREKKLQKKYKNTNIKIKIEEETENQKSHYEKNILKKITEIDSWIQKVWTDWLPIHSWNVWKIHLTEEWIIKWKYFMRSNTSDGILKMKNSVLKKMENFAHKWTKKISHKLSQEIPVWENKNTSYIADKILQKISQKESNILPAITTHATVEVWPLSSKYPKTEWVSIGATCHNMHTPEEHIYLEDFKIFYERLGYIIDTL